MNEMEFTFEHEGRTIRPGQMMHVAPEFWGRAGRIGTVERYHGDSVTLRAPNGAVPTVPLHGLLWSAHPITTAYEELQAAGFDHPTVRDADVWMAARALGPNEKHEGRGE